VALLEEGRIAEAITEFRETLRFQPDKIASALTLAWILATAPENNLRDGNSALEYAKRAFQLAGDRNLMTYRVLAAAYAETGKFQAAINAAEEGAQRAQAADQPSIAELLENDLTLYRERVPLRDEKHGRDSAAAAR
jgi:protein O-mannosyl-transferase